MYNKLSHLIKLIVIKNCFFSEFYYWFLKNGICITDEFFDTPNVILDFWFYVCLKPIFVDHMIRQFSISLLLEIIYLLSVYTTATG